MPGQPLPVAQEPELIVHILVEMLMYLKCLCFAFLASGSDPILCAHVKLELTYSIMACRVQVT